MVSYVNVSKVRDHQQPALTKIATNNYGVKNGLLFVILKPECDQSDKLDKN